VDPTHSTKFVSVNRADKIIQVSIVEDDSDIRDLLRILIHNTPGYLCENVFPDAESALDTLPQHDSDVVLMDIELPGMNGIECVSRLKELMPGSEFIMLTNQMDEDSIFDSLRAGASGYLVKDTPPVKLLEAIQAAHDGGAPMSPYIARKVTAFFRPGRTYDLSRRESEILSLLCKGKNYSTVAEELFISGHTVRAHIKNIYTKLHVNSRGEAVSKAIRDRIV
jgi:DNA-binding NarL/FixJ family response regulator